MEISESKEAEFIIAIVLQMRKFLAIETKKKYSIIVKSRHTCYNEYTNICHLNTAE